MEEARVIMRPEFVEMCAVDSCECKGSCRINKKDYTKCPGYYKEKIEYPVIETEE
jgi:hypothetical protein